MAIKKLNFPLNIIKEIIDTATDGLEAQALVRRRWEQRSTEYGLILSDCQMPRCDGYISTSKIRKFIEDNDMEQPLIVACTGNVEQLQIDKAFQCGFDEVVAKPVSIDAITEILSEVIII